MSIPPIQSQSIIPQEELKQILREFNAQRGESLHLTALGYFGSYARGEAGPESDIDIVFKTDYPNLLITSRLRLDLVELLNCPVDVIRYRDNMNPRLKARLDREAIYV
jgi:predicted nucleotidyltransferase